MQKRPQHKDKDGKSTTPPKGTSRGLAVFGILQKAPHLLVLLTAKPPYLAGRLKRKVQTVSDIKIQPRSHLDPIFTKNPNSRKSGLVDALTETKSPMEGSQRHPSDTPFLALPSLLDYSLQLARGLCSAGGVAQPQMLVQTTAKDEREDKNVKP